MMISGVFGKTSAIRLPGFFLILVALLFLALPAVAYADEITYTGDGKNLQRSPAWFDEENEYCFFPGAKAAPLFSGNKVTVNYNPTTLRVKNPGWVFGGLSEHENTADNDAVLLNGVVDYSILGGYSHSGNVTRNRVDISGGSVGGEITGGCSFGGDAVDNNVTISGGATGSSVYGGESTDGSVMGNTVLISSGSVDRYLHGGSSVGGNAADNNVTVSGGSVGSFVSGGWSLDGSVTDNTVAISGGSVVEDVSGGSSYHGKTAGNKVTISGGSVGEDVSGGFSSEGVVTGNTVIINDGSVGEDVYGGRSFIGDTKDNIVTISGGSVGGNICGGFCTLGDATGNLVTISGSPTLTTSYIYGGYVYEAVVYNKDKDFFSGNSLNFKSSGMSAKGVGNFEYYSFYLPEDLAADGIMLSVTEAVDLKGTTVAIFLQDDSKLNKGDKIALIHSTAGVSNAPKNKSCQAQQDGLLYEFSIYTDSNNLWAKVTKISSAAK